MTFLMGIILAAGLEATAAPQPELWVENRAGDLEAVGDPDGVWSAGTWSEALSLADAGHLKKHGEIRATKPDSTVEVFAGSRYDDFRRAWENREFVKADIVDSRTVEK